MVFFSNETLTTFQFNFINFLRESKISTNYRWISETIIPIIFCCSIYLITACLRRRQRSGEGRRTLSRSLSLGVLHAGGLAVERLIDYHKVRANTIMADKVINELRDLLEQERPSFRKLQRIIGQLEMSGKEGEGVKMLEKAVEKAMNERKEHEAYEFEMALVESLIYKGDYEKALGCHCLTQAQISDARRPLYKAVIQLMLNHPKEEARREWETFREIRRKFHIKDTPFTKIITNFKEFEAVIRLLKYDIQEAQHKQK